MSDRKEIDELPEPTNEQKIKMFYELLKIHQSTVPHLHEVIKQALDNNPDLISSP